MEGITTEARSLEKVHKYCIEKKFSFVSWRTPCSDTLQTGIQSAGQPEELYNIKSLEGKSGFVFAPFAVSLAFPIRLIVPDIIFTGMNYNGPLFEYPGNRIEPDNMSGTYPDSSHPCNINQYSTDPAGSPPPYPPEANITCISRSGYIAQVQQVKRIIANGGLDKLVLSRSSAYPRPEGYNPSQFLNALHTAYPEAFVYLLYIPGTGMWCGATPESLVAVSGNRVNTVSLAGTRHFPENGETVTWENKEIREQDIVTTYIHDVLKKFNITDYLKTGLESMKAGNLLHLKSGISFPLDELRGRLIEFIDELHPSPSVCGVPKEEAIDYIMKAERHAREYYTGFLGPVNTVNGDLKLFVNLRCMKIGSDSLQFFMGAGITSGSDPLKEWEETEAKKMTLVDIFNSINL